MEGMVVVKPFVQLFWPIAATGFTYIHVADSIVMLRFEPQVAPRVVKG